MISARIWSTFALALLIALGTWFLAWWTVPILGALAGVVVQGERRWAVAGAAGALAWGSLLLMPLVAGHPVDVLASRLAGAMQLPPVALVFATLLLAALLAGTAAAFTAALRSAVLPRP